MTVHKLEQLKDIIDETLCSATNFLLEQEEVKPSFDHVDMVGIASTVFCISVKAYFERNGVWLEKSMDEIITFCSFL